MVTSRRTQGVLLEASCAGIARTHRRAGRLYPSCKPFGFLRLVQTLRVLPLPTRRKGQGPKAKPADTIQDLTSSRPDLWAAGIHHWNRMPPVLQIGISHCRRRNGTRPVFRSAQLPMSVQMGPCNYRAMGHHCQVCYRRRPGVASPDVGEQLHLRRFLHIVDPRFLLAM